jgi:hypothetical protein
MRKPAKNKNEEGNLEYIRPAESSREESTLE